MVDSHDNRLLFSQQLQNSALANLVGMTLGHPIETLKVKYQQSQNLSLIETLLINIKVSGFKSFFNGYQVPLFTYVPYYTITFTLKEQLPFFLSINNLNSFQEAFLYGGLSSAIGLLLYQPCELIKLKAQASSQKVNYLNILENVQKEGISKGYWATFWREVPGFACYFGLYEWCKIQGLTPTISGGFAGGMAWLVGIPQDVVKTKIQASLKPMTIQQAIINIKNEEGYKGFFKGGIPLVARGILINIVVLPLFDYLNGKQIGSQQN